MQYAMRFVMMLMLQQSTKEIGNFAKDIYFAVGIF